MPDELTETLRQAQRFGFFGSRPIEDAMRHSQSYVDALGRLSPGTRLVDLGSGGGLPGLVLAAAFPGARITLIDRREKRTDFLHRAVARLGYGHVDVMCADVDVLVRRVRAGEFGLFDVVTARGFGPPADTLRYGVALSRPAGRVVISDPPSGDRWPPELLAELGVDRRPAGPVSVFTLARG